MPKEKITAGDTREASIKEGLISEKPLFIKWNRIGWVQLTIESVPWIDSDQSSTIVDLRPKDIDRLIKVLQKAKKQAYGEGHRHHGFWDNDAERLADEIRGAILTDKQKADLAQLVFTEAGKYIPHAIMGEVSLAPAPPINEDPSIYKG